MKYFEAPDGSIIYIPKGRVIAFGFTTEEVETIKNCLPSDDHVVYVPDVVTDILAINHESLIIKADSVSPEDRDLIVEYYTELNGCFDETVFWLGYPKPPSHLRLKFYCYEHFDQLVFILPKKLIKAHQKVKKARAFSKNLADCLQILSMIRLKPGIKTQELSEKLELPIRTVQRHIAALQAAGEWIEYDTKKRGWQLQYGLSVLFGDHLKNYD